MPKSSLWPAPRGEDTAEQLVFPDVEMHLADGTRWSATVATTADIEAVMNKNARTGEDLGGRFFACPDLLIVRDSTLDGLLAVVESILASGEVRGAFRELPPDRDATGVQS